MNPIEGRIIQPGQRAIALDDDERSVRIQLATQQDVKALAAGDAVAIVKGTVAKTPEAKQNILRGLFSKPSLQHVYIRSESGDFHQIGFATDLQIRHQLMDVTGFGDSHKSFAQGPIHATMTVAVSL